MSAPRKPVKKFSLLVVAIAALLAPFIDTTPAAAAVWGCNMGFNTVGPWAQCSQGDPQTPYYQVRIVCAGPANAYSYYKGGNWVTVSSGQPSTINGCNNIWEHYVGNPWVSSSS